MIKYYVQIKTINDLSNKSNGFYSNNNLVEMFLIEAENKEEIKRKLLSDFPQLFPNGEVYMRTTKKKEQLCYVSIEPCSQWIEEKLLGMYVCEECGEKFTGIDYFNLNRKFPINAVKKNGLWEDKECSEISFSCVCSQTCKDAKRIREQNEYFESFSDVYYIYRITEKKTGKCYIGQTSNAVFFRWWDHFKHSTQEFGETLRKRSLSEFNFEVLEELDKSKYTREDILKKETKYIRKYDSIKNGFNKIVSLTAEVDNQISLFVED